jgi:hypothetical protein
MSEENVRIVRGWIDGWVDWFNSERDPAALAAIGARYTAPGVITRKTQSGPMRRHFAGGKQY